MRLAQPGHSSLIASTSESAVVALLIFAVHTITLVVLCVAAIVFVIRDQGVILTSNYHAPYPDINMAGQW